MSSFVDSRDSPKVEQVNFSSPSPISTGVLHTRENEFDKIKRDDAYLKAYDTNVGTVLGQKISTVGEYQRLAEQQRKTELDTAWDIFVSTYVNENLKDPANSAFIRQNFKGYLEREEKALEQVFQNTMKIIFIKRRGGPVNEEELKTLFVYQLGKLPVIQELIDENVFFLVKGRDYKRGMLNIKTFLKDVDFANGKINSRFAPSGGWGAPDMTSKVATL